MFRSITLPMQTNGFLAVTFFGALLAGCGSDSPSQIEQGKQAITAHACTSCHGANLAGDTNPQSGTMAYPANLTPDEETGMGVDWTTDMIVNAILNGVDDEGATLCATMPKFAGQMTNDEAKAIASYLKSLPPVNHKIPESMCAGKP